MGHRILYIPKIIKPVIKPVFGLLYNPYAITDNRKMVSDGWHIVSRDDYFLILEMIYGGSLPSTTYYISNGHSLCEEGTLRWYNDIGTDLYGFKAIGSGRRTDGSADFISLKTTFAMIATGSASGGRIASVFNIPFHLDQINFTRKDGYGYIISEKAGYVTRAVKNNTDLTADGQTGEYTGCDGTKYKTVRIAGIEITSENLYETQFQNEDIIPWYGASQANYFTQSEWFDLTTGACCAYNNDVNNVAAGFSFPDY